MVSETDGLSPLVLSLLQAETKSDSMKLGFICGLGAWKDTKCQEDFCEGIPDSLLGFASYCQTLGSIGLRECDGLTGLYMHLRGGRGLFHYQLSDSKEHFVLRTCPYLTLADSTTHGQSITLD